jgi:sugar lactone lactonase YvrE
MKSQLSLLALFLALTCNAQITVSTVITNGLSEPFDVVVDADGNAYISDSGHNRIARVDASTDAETTLAGIPSDPPGSNDGPSYAAHFNNPQGLLAASLGGVSGLLVTDSGNNLLRFVRLSDGTVTTLAGQINPGPAGNATGTNATFRYPNGLAQDGLGNVYIADWGNNTIRVVNLSDPLLGVTNVVLSGTSLYRPTGLAFAGTNQAGAGQLWVADTGNDTVKLITLTSPTTGTLTTYLGTPGRTGTNDAVFGPSALFNAPGGLLWVDQVGLLISDTLNNSIRLATNNPVLGPTNYSVFTFAGTPGPANGALIDGSALSAHFNSPEGMASDPDNNGFLVADLKNNALRRISTGPPLPPVPAPVIGWVDYQPNSLGVMLSVLETNQPFLLNNAYTIAIEAAPGIETLFTWGPTPLNPLEDTIPDPSATVGSTAPSYENGVTSNNVPASILSPGPDLTVKAISIQTGRINSPVVSARFQFQTADPQVIGNNGASFIVTDQTANALIWYTFDGSDPTNASPSLGPVASGATLSIDASTNVVFKAMAFCPNFQNSDIVSATFLAGNYLPNRLTLGFAAGQASSDFIASPGQTFYAPVTLTVMSNTTIFSLQFDITVTNAGSNPGPAVTPGQYGFQSTLMQPVPGSPGAYMPIPPYMYLAASSGSIPPEVPPSQVRYYNNLWFEDLEFTNSSLNMLGVGWLERAGASDLFNTSIQDLIEYSEPHDTIFSQAGGQVVVGEYTFQVPTNALNGQTYQIQLARPSATSDGIGDPGSEVVIAIPTNGPITATRTLTLGQRKYIAGDSAPFRWFNAGEFGDTNLDNSDVMQVFEAAVYGLDAPPQGSDLFDSMDSCGYTYTVSTNGYLQPNTLVFGAAAWNPLFDGNDTTINQIAFGDGVLDVCDVYVTFRRSLDPTLTWFQRFWTNGVRAAQFIGNPPAPVATVSPQSLIAQRPSVNFAGADFLATPGQTLQVPITAQVFGPYPLRVLMLGLTVNPLDGSPPLTSPVQFAPNPALGQPTLASAQTIGNYAATWLDSTIAGFSGAAALGTLTVQIPTNAPTNAAYAVHFDHASASPNGLASFPKQTLTGLITLSDRSASSYNDGIPDSWRLRYFGTVSNLLSQASADADGDGADNWDEYLAGTDPTDPKSCLRLSGIQTLSSPGPDCVLRWPSVAGKQYVLESSATLFTPNWIPLSTNSGSGADLIFQDTSAANARFYRVRLVTQ